MNQNEAPLAFKIFGYITIAMLVAVALGAIVAYDRNHPEHPASTAVTEATSLVE